MKLYARFVLLIMWFYIFIKILKRDISFRHVHAKYMRHRSIFGDNRLNETQDGDDSSEHPKTYKEMHLKHISSKSLSEKNYTEGTVIETLPANQTSRLFGIDAGKLVKVIRMNVSVVVEQIIGNKYRLIRKLGEGRFGKVYLAIDIKSGNSVAIKLEITEKTGRFFQYEEPVYGILEGEGFPNVQWNGTDGIYHIMAMELLGPSLGEYFVLCNKRLGLVTTLVIADQLIRRLEFIHSKGFLHRDVRPENFLVGIGDKSNVIYPIDLGWSKQYRSKDNEHIPYRENAEIVGTLDYASDNKLRHIQQSRRDDMVSIGYMLMYFLRGPFPWQKLHISSDNKKSAKILSIRKSVTIDVLCNGYPKEFATYLKKCQSLRFDEEPDYHNLRLLFSNLLRRQNMTSDYMFDWQVANGKCKT